MIRIAAVGDIHLGEKSRGAFRPAFEELPDCADVLLLAGDLTQHGTAAEAKVLADEVADLGVPVIAVLGNHDWHSDAADQVTGHLYDVGVRVLEGLHRAYMSNFVRDGKSGGCAVGTPPEHLGFRLVRDDSPLAHARLAAARLWESAGGS